MASERQARKVWLARHDGLTAREIIGHFTDPWTAIAYAELECPGTERYTRRLCVVMDGLVYPFTVTVNGLSEMVTDIYEALVVACPR